MQQQLQLDAGGTHFDLRQIFDRLNARYFRGRLRNYKVVWGRRRRQPPKDYFVFGTIQEEDRVIRINPRLDQAFVPRWFLEYVLYHEMLHSVVPDELDPAGRRRVHTDEFNRREKMYPGYRRAHRWEEENLARFLR
ncbi:MAG: SprT-like domain-containing protein [Chthoniobacterales bacterium]